MTAALLLAVLAAPPARAATAKITKVESGSTQISEDITVRAKAAGPALAVPPPAASRPVVDEVLQSLPLGRGAPSAPSAETVRVTPETTRLEQPFPLPPFLNFSPENVQAQYDRWTFEVRAADGEIAAKSEGVSRLRDKLDWDGAGPDGRLTISAGRRYFYRFTGRRGGREFVIESEPVVIKSFTHREWAGETRLEVTIDELFADGKAAWATGAERYLDAMSDSLRAGEARADGTFRFELYTREPKGKLTAARIKALRKRFAAALLCDPAKVKVAPIPAERGEALAAFVPPAKGPRLRND